MDAKASPSIIRIKTVEARTGLRKTTIYDYVRAGKFPPPVRIGNRATGFIESEVNDWIAKQIERSRASLKAA